MIGEKLTFLRLFLETSLSLEELSFLMDLIWKNYSKIYINYIIETYNIIYIRIKKII